jgi:hypothetical protein
MDPNMMISISLLVAALVTLLYSLDLHVVTVKVTIDGQDEHTDPDFNAEAYARSLTTPRSWAVAGHYAKALLSRKSPVYKSSF